ncbi:MAG: class II fructose-bisphosphate aldolase [Chloroflexota bacterium]|nr:class II fructose-bisphosphate aldolase [Chloroflexota bacterium]
MSTPTVARSVRELLDLLDGVGRLDDDRLTILEEAAFRQRGIRDLAWSATFSEDAATVEAARWLIWEASQSLGSPSASIHELYMARGRGEVSGFTVPAVNLRTQVFDMAAAMCRAAQSIDAGTIVFELARSEQEYTFQRPGEFITSVLAGCISASWQGPVFVQGDHYQFNAKKYAADPEGTTGAIRRLTSDALRVGYGNIDIDSSTLVDLSFATVAEQQRENLRRAAEIAALIREQEPAGMTVSIGGEIGEVGKQNSTEEELRSYLEGFRQELDRLAGSTAVGLSKVSVQTGTSHGGVPLPGGGVAEVKLDFGTLERLSAVCREYGLAGAVQHGASTLPDESFDRFPEVETAEIHLATGFQNLLYDHPALPEDLRAEMEAWCHANTADERKDGESGDVFLYKTRKKALGPFKRELWDLAEKDEIVAAQEAKFRFLFEQLGIAGNRAMVERYITVVPRSRPLPESLPVTEYQWRLAGQSPTRQHGVDGRLA